METRTYISNMPNTTNTGEKPETIRLYGAVPDSIVDGPGLRYAVFVQGCSHGCSGCHNPLSQPREGGEITTIDAVFDDIRANGLVHDVTFSGGEPFEQAAACAVLAQRLKALGYGIWVYTGYLYEDLEHIAQSVGEAVEDNLRVASTETAPIEAVPAETEYTETTVTEIAPTGTVPTETAPVESVPTETAPIETVSALLDAQGVADLLDCVDVLVDGPFIEAYKSLGLQYRGSSNQRLIDVAATRTAGHIVEWSQDVLTFEKPASW